MMARTSDPRWAKFADHLNFLYHGFFTPSWTLSQGTSNQCVTREAVSPSESLISSDFQLSTDFFNRLSSSKHSGQ